MGVAAATPYLLWWGKAAALPCSPADERSVVGCSATQGGNAAEFVPDWVCRSFFVEYAQLFGRAL